MQPEEGAVMTTARAGARSYPCPICSDITVNEIVDRGPCISCELDLQRRGLRWDPKKLRVVPDKKWWEFWK